MALLAELRRRNGIRMADPYRAASWLFVRASRMMLPMSSAAEMLPRALVVLLAILIVPSLAIAWVFDTR